MSDFDTAAWLASLLGHLNQHPHLNGNLCGIGSTSARVHAGRMGQPEVAGLAEWIRTLVDVTPVEVTCVVGDGMPYTHLRTSGRFADGTVVRVVACLDDEESDLLAANTPLEVGATFPVELLYRLGHAAVERVSS